MFKKLQLWWNGLFFGQKEIISFIKESGPYSFRTIRPALLESGVYIPFNKLFYNLISAGKKGLLRQTEKTTVDNSRGVKVSITEIFYS